MEAHYNASVGRDRFNEGTADPRRTYEELLASEVRYRMAIEQSPLAIHVFAPDGTSLLANAAWDELWYLREGEEPEGTNILDEEQVRVAGLLPYVKRAMSGETQTPPPLFFDPAKTGHEGRPRWLQPFIYPVEDEAGRVRQVTLIIEDITERKKLEEELSYRANYDALTGLANRALFMDRLRGALERAERNGGTTKVALLFTDLDNFKYVNDSLGHRAGDDLLVGAAERLKGCLGPSATVVARIGGDEFAVVLEGAAGPADAAAAAEGIARCLADAPFDLPGGRELFATTSTGIALGGPGEAGGAEAEDLLRSADTAMYRAKERGKDRHEAYEAGMRGEASERLGLEGDLRRALEGGGGDFRVFYQPEVSLEDGRIVGFEALVRWEHPERGLVPPARFMSVAEETGLIVPLGRWVLEEACRQAKAWQERYPSYPPLTMSVNLSARQFGQPGLAETVRTAIDGAGLDPGSLVLEITESAVMEDAQANAETLHELKGLGVGVAIDDFGTGYSSLAYLKRFPVDYLKIDRSFVDGLGEDPDDEGIVSSVVNLARTLNLQAVAEGVETEEQRALLRGMDCELAQGFYFSKPSTAEDASALLAAGPRLPAPRPSA